MHTVWPENLVGIKFGGLLLMAEYKKIGGCYLAVSLQARMCDVMSCAC